MSRHTLNDGVTPDSRITSESYDEWQRDLAPPAMLLGAYYKRGLGWAEFEKQYLEYIRSDNVGAMVRELAERAVDEDITLLCIEEEADHCHRRILAEECKRYESGLKVEHR